MKGAVKAERFKLGDGAYVVAVSGASAKRDKLKRQARLGGHETILLAIPRLKARKARLGKLKARRWRLA